MITLYVCEHFAGLSKSIQTHQLDEVKSLCEKQCCNKKRKVKRKENNLLVRKSVKGQISGN